MAESANTHLLVNVRDRTGTSSYQSATFNAIGENIIQGQIKKISVSEVLFPYDIPNVQAGFNVFELEDANTLLPRQYVVIPPGFYTGPELAAAASDIANYYDDYPGTPSSVPANELPVFTYVPDENRFIITVGAVPNPWEISSPYTFPVGYVGIAAIPNRAPGKDILSIMGFYQPDNPIIPLISSPVEGGSAPLLFTQYIDICSPQLCKYQFFRDGSTTNLARRLDVVCRLYIEDETSTPAGFDASGNPILAGSRPFVIHRQFKNERIMRWTSDGAIGTMDLLLFDDIGQPLLTTYGPRPYQITFLAYEMDKAPEQNGGYRY
jgi:hypothetical protein